MAFESGTKLGSYEITGGIGAGGMGEVYRATDTKLGREVAIKTLPAGLADDKDRLARFEREAKLLAALNHPHIASVYSLDEHDDTLYIAMELVEGETLEEKLKKGALSVDDALQLALQIAEALEAAHDKGVIHRDLKPANVMVTGDGIVKVLDFGLAKAFADDPNQSSADHSPALSLAMTQQGLVLGTAGYMSPEQASGQPTDQRGDIWSFGVVLYEMLTGLPLFSGESVPHILADVLKTEPDWDKLPENLHPRLKLMLERCLTKRPRNRYHSIADARVDIQAALNDPAGALANGSSPSEAVIAASRQPLAARLAAALLLGAAITAGVAFTLWPDDESAPVRRFVHEIPVDVQLRSYGYGVLAVAPDGSAFAYNTFNGIYLREIDDIEARPVSGTVGPFSVPVFSPDGSRLAFQSFENATLARIATTGGSPVVVAPDMQRDIFEITWHSSGTIFFSNREGVHSVAGNGGTPELILPSTDEDSFLAPQLLPDGDTLIVTVVDPVLGRTPDWDSARIVAVSLSSREQITLFDGGSDARFIETGHIVYMSGNDLFGVAFDPDGLQVHGGASQLVQGISRSNQGRANFGVTQDGTLIYLTGASESQNTLVWVDRNGGEERINNVPVRNYQYAQLSPDGTKIALDSRDDGLDIWVFDLARENLQQVTLDPDMNRIPTWSPDGSRVIFTGISDNGTEEIYWQAPDGAGVAEPLTAGSSVSLFTGSISPDGTELLAMTTGHPRDIYRVELGGDPQAAEPLLATPFDEYNPNFSPNGEWIAYQSNEEGQFEVYLRPYPDIDARRVKVSRGGGSHPLWSPDGSELFYLNIGGAYTGIGSLWSVPIDWSDGMEPGVPQLLIEGGVLAANQSWQVYDYSPEDERFLMVRAANDATVESSSPRVIIIENWTEELKRVVPAN